MTNELLVNRFLNQQKRDGKSILTLSAYATDLKQFSLFLSVSSSLSISPSKLNEVCRKWIAGLSPNAAARKLTTLRLFLKWGYAQGYIKKDLSVSVFLPKRQAITPAKPLTPAQITRLRRIATVQERLLLELILQTGMKLPQIVKIKTKSFFSSPLPPRLRQALDYYLAESPRGPKSCLLINSRGRQLSIRTATMILTNLGKRSKVRSLTARNLRATYSNEH